MSILFDREKRLFTLHTKETTYQMQVDDHGFLLHLYYGRTARGAMDFVLTGYDRGFCGVPNDLGRSRLYSMDVQPQEFPVHGIGDHRTPALRVKNEAGAYGCDLRYVNHQIKKGKYSLPGLPAVYAGEDEAETLEILLEDSVSKLQVTLLYGVLPEFDVITRSVRLYNGGGEKLSLEKVQSACLDFVSGKLDVISFYGRHAMERNFQRIPASYGNQVISSSRGASSHQQNPMLILADPETGEDSGSCYVLSYVYSGGFKGEVEKDQLGQVRALLGLQDEMFSYPLKPGEGFTAPEAVLSYTHRGLNRLSQNLHRCYRTHLCRGKFRDKVRPVLVNNWEATYFQFTGEKIYQLAKQAADLGIEMLVLDDGWFGKRNDDNASLGDWVVNEEKMGGSLGELIKKINGLGVEFGIWVEPEMISEESRLYKAHPDWALALPGRKPVRSRNQLVLDYSRKDVVDYIFQSLCNVLDQGNITYVKWDFNRSISDVYSALADDQGRVLYDYMLGLYDLLERLFQKYPNLFIEGCSGGGGRFDAGMLYYTPQIWCSDNTDAIDRLRIQYGTSFGYPTCAVGSHVSAVPNHQTGRRTSLHTRGVVAMSGSFGYELDLGALTEEEKNEVREQVKTFHKYAPLIHTGLYYRLTNPFSDEVAAWAFVSPDGSQVLVQAVMQEVHGNMTVSYLKLKGLSPEGMYEEKESGRVYSGAALMEIGLPLPRAHGEYEAHQLYFELVKP